MSSHSSFMGKGRKPTSLCNKIQKLSMEKTLEKKKGKRNLHVVEKAVIVCSQNWF